MALLRIGNKTVCRQQGVWARAQRPRTLARCPRLGHVAGCPCPWHLHERHVQEEHAQPLPPSAEHPRPRVLHAVMSCGHARAVTGTFGQVSTFVTAPPTGPNVSVKVRHGTLPDERSA